MDSNDFLCYPDLCLIFFVKLHQLTGSLFHNLVCVSTLQKALGTRLTASLFLNLWANSNGISDFKSILVRDFPDVCL